MTEDIDQDCRFFVSYSGVKLPFNLVNPIPSEGLSHRNTFIRAYFDKAGTLSGFDKVVYGEVELSHRYEYHDNGVLKRAEIVMLDAESEAKRPPIPTEGGHRFRSKAATRSERRRSPC